MFDPPTLLEKLHVLPLDIERDQEAEFTSVPTVFCEDA